MSALKENQGVREPIGVIYAEAPILDRKYRIAQFEEGLDLAMPNKVNNNDANT